MLNFLNRLLTISPTESAIMVIGWIIIIILAVVLEAETTEFVSCWFALGGIVGLILNFCKVSIYIQVLVATIVSVLLILVSRPLVKKLTKNDDVPTNADRLKGMIATIVKPIEIGEKGTVKVNYQTWSAVTNENRVFKEGEKVIIKEIEGNKLIVGKIEEIEIK